MSVARRVRDFSQVGNEPGNIKKSRNRLPFLGLTIDHQRRAHAAVGVTAAGKRAPLRLRAMDQVGKIGERADRRNGKPIAARFDLAHLPANVFCKVRKRIALLEAPLRSDVFVASGERNRLEAHEGDFLGVLHGELHDRSDLVVVYAVDDGDHRNDLNPRFVHVFDRSQLYVKQVAHLPVAVRVVSDAVKLQVGIAQARFEGFPAELLALGKFNAVRRGLDAVVAELLGVGDGLNEVWTQSRFAAGELHGHLAPRLDFQRVVENLLDFIPRQFVDVAYLVGIHEARITHHVAPVG